MNNIMGSSTFMTEEFKSFISQMKNWDKRIIHNFPNKTYKVSEKAGTSETSELCGMPFSFH